jgi:hypothetical protein
MQVRPRPETPRTVELARQWADETGTELLVDRSEVRRSCKEARNVLMERAEADILIQIDADVAVARSSIAYLLLALTGHPEAEVASGCVLADPQYSDRFRIYSGQRRTRSLHQAMARTRRNRGAFTEYWDITPSTKSL